MMAVQMKTIREGMKRYIKLKNDAAKILFALVILPVSTLSRLLPN